MKAKNVFFTLAGFFIGLFFIVTILICADILYRWKYKNFVGINYRGYRGDIIGKKGKDEIRIAILGGSFAFGYGVRFREAIPVRLQNKLQDYCDAHGYRRKIKVINLAYNNEGSYAFYYNLNDFYYLNYDYVILCEGYNDIGIGNMTILRHNDAVFRIFNYWLSFPMIIKEKVMALKNGSQLEKAYWMQKVVFRPNTKRPNKDCIFKYYY